MSVNNIKMLELLSIEEVNYQYFLKLKIYSFTDQSIFYWLIDNDTANAIQEICNFNSSDRYRLSLQATYDQRAQQYTSYVTQTFRDTSKRHNFYCSSLYSEQLERIKNCQSIKNLLFFEFLFTTLPKEQVANVVNDNQDNYTAAENHDIQQEMDSPLEVIHQENEDIQVETDPTTDGQNISQNLNDDIKEIEHQQNNDIQDEISEEETVISDELEIQSDDVETISSEKSEEQNKEMAISTDLENQMDEETVSDVAANQHEEKENKKTKLIPLPKVSFKKIRFDKIHLKKMDIGPGKLSTQHVITACLIVAILLIILVIVYDTYSQSITKEPSSKSNEYIAVSDSNTTEDSVTLDTDEKQEESSIPTLQIEGSLTFNIPEGYVALTFDNGPSKYTKSIVDILKEKNVGGTFFFIGYNVQKHPKLVEYAHSNGYSIGSHSMTNSSMNEQTIEEQQYEIAESKKVIEDIIQTKVTLFRPPNGLLNEGTQKLAEKEQCKIILWNNDPKTQQAKTANEIIENMQNIQASGSIISFNESQPLVEALPTIIEHLQKQNLKIVCLQ